MISSGVIRIKDSAYPGIEPDDFQGIHRLLSRFPTGCDNGVHPVHSPGCTRLILSGSVLGFVVAEWKGISSVVSG